MSGKRLPTGKQWEAGALAAVPVDYASVDYVPKVVANPNDASAPLLEYVEMTSDGGTGGDLDDLDDVDTTGVANDDVLGYDSGTSTWTPRAPSVGGGATTVSALIATSYGWWESTRIPVVADGTALTLLNDASPFGRSARQALTLRATYETNEINTTLPAVRFDGTNDNYALVTGGVMTCLNGFTAVVVAKQNSQAQFGSLFCGSSANTLDLQFKQTSGKLAIVNANTAERLAQTTTPSAGYHMWEAHFNGDAGHEIVMDGTADGTATVTTTYGDVSTIGRNANTNNQFLAADVVLLAFFTRMLTAGERTTIRDYVRTTYGLTIA